MNIQLDSFFAKGGSFEGLFHHFCIIGINLNRRFAGAYVNPANGNPGALGASIDKRNNMLRAYSILVAQIEIHMYIPDIPVSPIFPMASVPLVSSPASPIPGPLSASLPGRGRLNRFQVVLIPVIA